MKNIVYLDGNYIPQKEATISVMDRGFLFGDSIYEVVPIFNGKLIGLSEHMARLERSLAAIHMTMPLTAQEWQRIIYDLLQKNDVNENVTIYLQITRGTQEIRDHHITPGLTPTVFACLLPTKVTSYEYLSQGFSAITLDDSRRRDCYIKSTCLLPNVLAQYQANQNNALEAILIRDGKVLEATSSNVFLVKDEILITPPLSPNILGGITRDIIIQLAKENNITVQERDIQKDELETADEIWVTGSSKEICPITQLDGCPVGNGEVGAVWHEMIGLYYQFKNAEQTFGANEASAHD